MNKALALALIGLAIRSSYTGPVETQRTTAAERADGKRHVRKRHITTTIKKKSNKKKPKRKVAYHD
jgi:hypothetical protein